jgi:DnaK suppressor protein
MRVDGQRPSTPGSGQDLAEDVLRQTNLTEAELAEFRDLLLEKRRELVGDVKNLSDEARRVGAPGGAASTMPIHMADLGSDTWEQELTLGLIENERGLLREIDEALDRIDKKTYGICIATNKPIGKARLRLKPWAKYCIEYARKRELGQA